MKPIIQFFVDSYKFTYILMVFLIIFGVIGLSKINSESYPAVNFATAVVTTNFRGAGPEDIEEQVTKPIEDEIRTVRGLKDTRSISQAGLSKITVRVDMDRYNVKDVMNDLQKAVQRVTDLPPEIDQQPKFEELNSEEFPAIEMAILGPNEERQRDEFGEFLRDLIEDNKKVLDVRLSGSREREFSVRLLQDKLDQFYVSISEVSQALTLRNQNIPAGDLESEKEKFLVQLKGKVRTADELKNVYIRSNYDGRSIQLKDVAIVEDGMEDPKILARVNAEEATLLTVTKKGGEDTIELVQEINNVLATVNMPEGMSILIYNNEAGKVKNRMQVLQSNAFAGLFLVVLFMFIFLPGKIGFLASLSLPLTVMGTIGLMYWAGMNLDAITVLALVIALGMLVDNSVVISENFARLVKQGIPIEEAVVRSAHQFWLPITCTAFTTIAAFLPMLVTKGVMGEFIKYIPIIVSFSLLLSLGESFFLLPSRLLLTSRKGILKNASLTKDSEPEADNNGDYTDWFARLTSKFETLMGVLISMRYLVALLFTSIIFGSLFMVVKVNKFVLFPAEQTEVYVARFELPRGMPVLQTHAAAAELSRNVKEVLGNNIENIVARAGIIQTDPGDPKAKEGENYGMLLIYVTKEASFSLDYNDALAQLRQIEMPDFAKLSFEVVINGPPVGAPVNATLRSNFSDQLTGMSNDLIAFLGEIDGVVNPQTDRVIGANEIMTKIDYEKLARFGLSVAEVGAAIKTSLEGIVVTEMNLNNKTFDLKVKYAGTNRKNLDDLKKIKIMDQRGNLIPLPKLASFELEEGTPVIKRFDFQRAITVLADIDEEKITSIQANAMLLKEFENLKKKYPMVTLVFGGEQESTNESLDSLGEAMVLASIAIFGILVFLFSSYLRPLLIMSTIPLGLFGFSIAFYFHNRPISFLSLIGVIGLAGIIVNSGIVLVSFIDEMREQGEKNLRDILVKASGMRLRAVVVTSLTTISGLFPTAYGIGGSDLILVPMTLAMAWGLTSGTILTLIWLPCAYAILEDWNQLMRRMFKRKELT